MIKTSLHTLLMTTTLLTSSAEAIFNGEDENPNPAQNAAAAAQPDAGGVVENEGVGRYYFDGHIAAGERAQIFRHLNGQRSVAVALDGEILDHGGNEVVHVELLEWDEEAEFPADPVGYYVHRGDLQDNRILGREEGSLVYCDGEGGYFLPHVTQEKWAREHWEFRAFVASTNENRRLHFVTDARWGLPPQNGEDITTVELPQNPFPRGLYNLEFVEDKEGRRHENWRRLGLDGGSIVITAPQGCPSIPGMGAPVPFVLPTLRPEVEEIQKLVSKNIAAIDDIELPNDAKGLNILLGFTGSAKTTTLLALMGKPLEVAKRADGRGLCLDTPETLAWMRLHEGEEPRSRDFQIGHSLNKRGTLTPNFYYDRVRKQGYLDCHGFGDPEGGEMDIALGCSLDYLLKKHWKAKLLFVMGESQVGNRDNNGLTRLLSAITSVFNNDELLKARASFLFTGQDRINDVSHFLEGQLRELRGGGNLNEKALGFLQFLTDNPDRIATFPYPQRGDIGSRYDTDDVVDDIHRALGPDREYVKISDDELGFYVGGAGELASVQLANRLNTFMVEYLKTEGSRRLMRYCRGLVERNGRSVDDHRQRLRGVVNNVAALADLPNGALFGNRLNDFFGEITFNDPDFRSALTSLDFLKAINPNVNLNVLAWVEAFDGALEKIETLMANPIEVKDGSILTLKGPLVGLSDLVGSDLDGITRIDLWATNKLFIDTPDADSKFPGVSMCAFAPWWDDFGGSGIYLNGDDGANGRNGNINEDGTERAALVAGEAGQSGQAGQRGQTAGSFYGKGFHFPPTFNPTVETNGGRGGNGGDGENGGTGRKGRDGDLSTHSRCGQWGAVPGIHNAKGTPCYYENRGTDGFSGGDAGQGGQGGRGGLAGDIQFVGFNLENASHENGDDGDDGKPGEPGNGGKHGRHCHGLLWKSVGQGRTNLGTVSQIKTGHSERDPEKAPRGRTVEERVEDGDLSAPLVKAVDRIDLIPINPPARTADFKDYFDAQAVGGAITGIFPNLVPVAPDAEDGE